jgi:hypothetical protein
MSKFLNNVDLNKNELQNARIQNLATAPADPVEGQVYHDTALHKTRFWNGSAWVNVEGVVGTVTSVSGTAPIASSGGATPAISLNDDGVTNAKLADAAANTLKGNATASADNPTDIALAANQFLARSSTGNIAAKSITDAGLSVLDDATVADIRATIGAGTVTGVTGTAPIASSGGAAPAISLNDDGVTNAKLADMAANTMKANATNASANPTDLALTANAFPARSSTGDIAAKTVSDFGLSLIDDANAAAGRATLGLDTATKKYTDAGVAVEMTHGLGTLALVVLVYVTATGEVVYPNITVTSTKVTLTFANAITEDEYTVVAIG